MKSSKMNQAQPSTTTTKAALKPVSGEKPATGVFDTRSGVNLRETKTFTPESRWGVRYSQTDPLGDEIAKREVTTLMERDFNPNKYGYANSSPFVFIDPLGLEPCDTPGHYALCLETLFGQSVDGIVVKEKKKWVRFLDSVARAAGKMGKDEYTVATTRREKILLNLSCDEFWADPELVLHEYFHIFEQWRGGTLTKGRYLKDPDRWEAPVDPFLKANFEWFEGCVCAAGGY